MQIERRAAQRLPHLLERVKESLLSDETLGEFAFEPGEFERFVTEQAKMLEGYFAHPSDEKEDEKVRTFYKTSPLPYPLVYKSLSLLKNELIKVLAPEIEDARALFGIEERIDRAANLAAREYVAREAEKLECVGHSIFRDRLLYRAHLEWIGAIREAVENDDMERFPLVSARDCRFGTYLKYPEALMVCMEEGLCNFLHETHELIHRNANTFYLLGAKGDYVQAYISFRELLLQVINFSKTISELYFVTYANLEERFFRLVEMLAWSRRPMRLSILDIRELRSLNHQYGERMVNRILEEAERRVAEIVGEDEERALAVRGVTATFYMLHLEYDDERMSAFAKRVCRALERPFEVEGKSLKVEFVLATLEMEGFHEKSRDDLTRLLLHLKKRARSRNRIYLVHDEEEKVALREWLVEAYRDIHFIKERVEKGEVEVLYQPIYELESGEIAVLEALVRLKEGKKLLPASLFIDTILELGLIERLDTLVLEKLLQKLPLVRRVAGHLFVNVSYRSLLHPAYAEALGGVVRKWGAERIVCELTEQRIVENVSQVRKMHEDLGIRFAVDDFGSGYSSLKTVADLAREGVLWAVKVDASLIRRIAEDDYSREMVRLIAQMCRVISVASVAEFVETPEELEALRRIGIDYAQGYHLSRPRRIEELLVEKVEGASGR